MIYDASSGGIPSTAHASIDLDTKKNYRYLELHRASTMN